jgi:hypothetical protein
MARPLRILYPNAFYHVTCRGNYRRVIFRDDHDRTRFLERLRSALEISSVQVHKTSASDGATASIPRAYEEKKGSGVFSGRESFLDGIGWLR